jgi:hypothetical protein
MTWELLHVVLHVDVFYDLKRYYYFCRKMLYLRFFLHFKLCDNDTWDP